MVRNPASDRKLGDGVKEARCPGCGHEVTLQLWRESWTCPVCYHKRECAD